MRTLQDLFVHQLKDLYSAEDQLVTILPKMAGKATDSKLKKVFEQHLEETKVHKNRIELICRELSIVPVGETCKAMEGLIKETEDFILGAAEDEILDVGLIANAQRIEHYEIAGYGSAVRFAKELEYRSVAEKLQTTLNDEYAADNRLDELAENRLNRKAINKV